MPPTRLGVIGAGLIWLRTHKPILQTMADAFEPIAFCDVSAERRADVAREFPGARVLSDQHELLALPCLCGCATRTWSSSWSGSGDARPPGSSTRHGWHRSTAAPSTTQRSSVSSASML